jgi:general secretion pathway protein F
VAEGALLAASLKNSGLFPAMLIQMVSTGEKTGDLGVLLVKASSFYEREFDSSIARAMALLEPGLILAMGLIVGFIVLAILLPIFELNQVVG